MDAAALLKATQIITQACNLDQLVRQLTRLLLETSAAQHCTLVLSSHQQWQVVAIAQATQGTVAGEVLLCEQPLEQCEQVPIQLILHLQKHGQSCDQTTAAQIAQLEDVYLQQQAPLSFWCQPVLLQGQAIACWYLEHRTQAAIFGPDQQTQLTLLGHQAAIAIDNAHHSTSPSLRHRQSTHRTPIQYKRIKERLEQQVMNWRQRLQISEQRLAGLSANLPAVLLEFQRDRTGEIHYLFMSQGVRGIYELASEQLPRIFDWIHPEDRPNFQAALAASATDLFPFQQEHRIVTPSQKQKWVKIVATPERRANGVIAWVSLVIDITGQKKAEAQLRLSEQRFRNIFQGLPMLAMQVYDRDRCVLDWNEASTHIYGYTREEAFGQKLEDLIIPPEMREETIQTVEHWLQGGPPIEAAELTLLHQDGSKVAVYSTHFVLPNAQGEPEIYCLDVDLRDRKRAEIELQRSKNLLELVINTLPGSIFFKDRDLNYLGGNQIFAEVAGVGEPENVVGKCDYDLAWKREEAEFFRQGDRHVMESGQAELGIIEPAQYADGRQVWVETSKAPLKDEKGQVIGMVGIAQDVTQREEAIAALHQKNAELLQAQELLQLVIDTLPGAVWWKDCNSVFQGANHYLAQISGMTSPTEIVGKTDYDLPWEKAEADFFIECDRRVIDSGEAELGIIERLHQADGTQTWLETNKAPLIDKAGNVIGLVGTFQDVTERENAAIALRKKTTELGKALDELQQTQDLLQLVIDTLPGAVWWKDRNSVFQGSNTYCAKIAGFNSPQELMGKSDYDLACKKEEADFFVECDRRVMDSGEAELGIIEPQHQVDGSLLWLETSKVPLRNREGAIIGTVGMFQDVTEREKAAIALRQKTTELEQALVHLQATQLQLVQTEKMSSLGQMVAGVAHEINNPVTFIHGNIDHAIDYVNDLLELIEQYQHTYPDPPLIIQDLIEEIDLGFLQRDFRQLIQSMRVGTERIDEIVRSLRNFSRLDESAVKAVNLHEGIDSTLTILQTRLRAQAWRPEIKIIRDYGQLPLIECYAGQLNQVFMNILSNGIDALEERDRDRAFTDITEQPSQITIRTRAIDGWVHIEIQDNGVGMKPETLERLFDPFFTTKPVGKGTGLGLSISYQIISEVHQGRLICTSQQSQGSTFLITLPFTQNTRDVIS